ncbi:MAG TPA: MMPL family transporter [Gaiellaceae bacterium]|nr:MMPL family transporter [Gaiellaceae bacterium]
MTRGQGLTERLARACAAHRRRTFAAWGLAVVVALVLVATSLHGLTSNGTVSGNPESARADNLISRAFPPTPSDLLAQSGDVVVVTSTRYTVDQKPFVTFVESLLRQGAATHKVLAASSYLTGGKGLVSQDRHSTLIRIRVDGDSDIKPIVAIVNRANKTPGFSVAVTGVNTTGNDFNTLSQRDLEHGELFFGLPAALVVLVLVFGAVVAGLVPVLMAILSIVVGLGLVAIVSLEFGLSVFIVNMLSGMGLALGIDYSLFVISRYREERAGGADKDEAIGLAGATASRAVLFSGSTFVVALFGMFLVPTNIMRSLALGAIIVGIVSVAAALTLLPALLSSLGDRVDSLRVPVLGRNLGHEGASESRLWRRVVDVVLRRPLVSLVLSAGLMVAAAVPLFGLHIGSSGVATLPNDLPSKRGYLALQKAFPSQSPYPAQIVVRSKSAPARTDLVSLQRKLAADSRFGPGAIKGSKTQDVLLLTVPVRGDPVSGPAISAVRDLHNNLIPAAFKESGAIVLVGGKTEENAEYYDAVTNPTPFVLIFVLGLSVIVLTVAFRSLAVALISIVLNLLSVGAAYGLITLVFLHGYAAGFFGFQHAHVVDAWVPLFLFSVLFGLSMDYQVFLLSRIKERYDRTGDTRQAVSAGVASTARIITGAALIIVVVFAGFARGQLVQFQQMGFGVAVALLLDATLIRSVVLPSVMSLLDRRSWYLPSWLGWLPHLDVERTPV